MTFGIPYGRTTRPADTNVVQAAGNFSASKVVTLLSAPTGTMIGGMGADSGSISAVTQGGYTWSLLLNVGGTTCCSLWVGVENGKPKSKTVTFTGGGGSFFSPIAIELVRRFQSPIVVGSVTKAQSAAGSITTPTITPTQAGLLAIGFTTATSGGVGIAAGCAGAPWADLPRVANIRQLYAVELAVAFPNVGIFATFRKLSGANFLNAGIVLLGDRYPQRGVPAR